MDRHPFFLDLKKPELFPAEQQRWIIVGATRSHQQPDRRLALKITGFVRAISLRLRERHRKNMPGTPAVP